MPYAVREALDQDVMDDVRLENISFFSDNDDVSAVKSNMMLLTTVQRGPARSSPSPFSRSRFLYRIVVQQQVPGKSTRSFVLFESDKLNKSEGDAFVQLSKTLSPLLSSGSVRLSISLLEEIILPEPLKAGEIGSRLVTLMEQDPDGHPEWHSVIQTLMKSKEVIHSMPSTDFQKRLASRLMTVIARQSGFLSSMMIPLSLCPKLVLNSFDFQDDASTSLKIYNYTRKRSLPRYNSQHFSKFSKTMLMEAVENQFLQSCMFLALSGVDPNTQYMESGDTALHTAVRLENLDIIKLLLAVEADPTVSNCDDETPLDAARKLTSEKAQDIISVLETIAELQAQAKAYNSSHMEIPNRRNSSDIYLLSLDGGGLKVFNTSLILARIEKRMKELCPDCPPLQSYFDYIAGVSAGATIGVTLAYQNESAQNMAVLLYKFMIEVVKKPLEERMEHLKHYMFEHFGQNTVLSDLERQRVIIGTVIANISPNQLHLMTSYGEPRDGKAGPNERKVWEALCASMAAPTYLPPFDNCFLDGGVMANNPTLPAMVEIFNNMEEGRKLGCVLSIGTGIFPTSPVEKIGVFVTGFSVSNLVSSAIGLKNLIQHFIAQSTRSDGEVVTQAETWCKSVGTSHFRFSSKLSKYSPMDSTDLDVIIGQLFDTEVYMLKEHAKIDQLAKCILSK